MQTRSLRPTGFPAFLGQDFFLSGYRIFTRYRNLQGRRLRGLRILRSDVDSRDGVSDLPDSRQCIFKNT